MNRRGFLGRLAGAVAAIVAAPSVLHALERLAPAEATWPIGMLEGMTATSLHKLSGSTAGQWNASTASSCERFSLERFEESADRIAEERPWVWVQEGGVAEDVAVQWQEQTVRAYNALSHNFDRIWKQGSGGKPFPCLDLRSGRSEAATRPFPALTRRNRPQGRAS